VSAPLSTRALRQRSLAVILAAQAPSGGYMAAPNYPTYRYVWARDGSFIAEAMRAVGRADSSARFHAFVADAVLRIADASGGEPTLLPARFEADGSLDRSGWPNHQLDGYGLWLWALERDPMAVDARCQRAAEIVARYLCRRWQEPCHDPWEEGGDTRPTATLTAVIAGLDSAGRLLGAGPWDAASATARDVLWQTGVAAGHLTKDLGRAEDVDAATLWTVAPLALLRPTDSLALGTIEAVETRLGAPAVHRHPRDTYYGGGTWPVLAALWGLARLALGDRAAASRALAWIEGTATAAGDLPEQVSDAMLAPAYLATWLAERGPVATPLVWSHAMYLLLARALDGDTPVASSHSGSH
jgi:GH15 family glucan-1,4-alpha-glucosidase